MQDPRKNLLDLGFSDSEITVYLAMVSGARTARDLVKVTRMKRPTVYYALGCLEKRGLIGRTGLEGDKKLSLEPIEKLSILMKEKALEFSKLQNQIEEMIPVLEAQSAPVGEKPTVLFYEGTDAVKNAIMEILYCKSRSIYALVPKENFFWQTGKDFVELFVEERVKRKIKVKNLWENSISKELMKKYYEGLSEVRILPEVMHGKFQTTIFLYDDKTLYISNKKNSYAVVIASKEHTDTLRAMFDGLWSVSTPHKGN